MQPPTAELVYLLPEQLRTHPKNMRRLYPDEQVRAMADSIRMASGVIHALRIVRSDQAGAYWVVDGHMRLAGARRLGAACPPLKCELVDDTAAEQLLNMAISNKLRFDPDPISEALHYRRLIDEEGYKLARLARATGAAAATIAGRLKLLKLEPEIQELIAARQLSADPRVSAALLSIPNPSVRLKLAQRVARRDVSIKAIETACVRVTEKMRAREQANEAGTPMLRVARTHSRRPAPMPHVAVSYAEVRVAAYDMCQACEVKSSRLQKVAEPAWETISHAAQDTCTRCNVRTVQGACQDCPGVELIQRLLGSRGEASHV